MKMKRYIYFEFAALLIFVFITHYLTLMQYPPPFVDEAWLGARAWNYIQTGKVFSTLDAGVIDRFEGYWTYFPWLPTWLQSISLRLYGAPALLPLRVVSLLFGLLLILSIYAIGNHVGGHHYGLLSALLVSLSNPFLTSAHLARQDIFVAAFGYSAIALHIINKSKRLWINLLSGLLVGLAFEMHPNAIIFGPVLLALFFSENRRKILHSRNFWAFMVGITIPILWYIAIHILPYPQTYWAIQKIIFNKTHIPPILASISSTPNLELTLLGRYVIFAYPLTLPLGIWATIELFKKNKLQNQKHSPILVLSLALLVAMILFVRNWMFYYIILLSPAFNLLVPAFIFKIIKQQSTSNPVKIFRYFLASLIIVMLIWQGFLGIELNTHKNYQNVQQKITSLIQPEDSIMSNQTYWLGLYEHDYYSWEHLVYYRQMYPESSIKNAMEVLRPDIFILDGGIRNSLSDQPFTINYFNHLRVSKTEMDNFLFQYGNLVEEFDGGYYGHIEVFRLDWERR